MSKQAVLTDDAGHFYFKPQRCDYLTDLAFIRAVHAYNDAVAHAANTAFDKAFRKAMP